MYHNRASLCLPC